MMVALNMMKRWKNLTCFEGKKLRAFLKRKYIEDMIGWYIVQNGVSRQ
jgi:hypothetical protein